MAKKSVGNKSAQNRRHYLRHKAKILARNKANYEANRSAVLERLSANKKTEKGKARKKLQDAVRSGKIKKPSICQLCFQACVPHAHHHDYSAALDVIWVCTKCHGKIHSNIGLSDI